MRYEMTHYTKFMVLTGVVILFALMGPSSQASLTEKGGVLKQRKEGSPAVGMHDDNIQLMMLCVRNCMDGKMVAVLAPTFDTCVGTCDKAFPASDGADLMLWGQFRKDCRNEIGPDVKICIKNYIQDRQESAELKTNSGKGRPPQRPKTLN